MNNRLLGKTGFKVSEIGLGCWQLGNDFGDISNQQSNEILTTAAASDITLLDTADVYGGGLSEQRIGSWLKQHAIKPIIMTKVGRDAALFPNKYTKEKVKQNIVTSLKRLQVEILDLVQLHCIPPEVLYNGEILNWMEDFQKEGLIHHFGASVESLTEAELCLTKTSIATIQIIFNIFRQDATETLLQKAADNNVGVIVRLPLASGLLSGSMSIERKFSANDHRNYNKNGEHFHVGETFNGLPLVKGLELAESLKKELPTTLNLHQVAMRWILDQPQVSTIIAGSTKKEQVLANAAISQLPNLPIELHQKLAKFYKTHVKQHIRGGI